MSTPIAKVQVTGYKQVRDEEYTASYTSIVGSYDKTFYGLDVTDGDVTIPITNIGTIKVIQVKSEDDTSVLKITAGGNTYQHHVSGYFYYEVDSTFAGTITAITISTASVTAISPTVVIYGV